MSRGKGPGRHAMNAATTQITALSDLLNGTGLDGLFQQMTWAEDEIQKAAGRHPSAADRLFHSFTLLRPTHDRMTTEFVYRSHCAEILQRVISGADTTPATAAELCCVCGEASCLAPLNRAAVGLYMRMWSIAFPDKPVCGDQLQHYEAIVGTGIDNLEAESRAKFSVDDRLLGDVHCAGMHHGEPVSCSFATQTPDQLRTA
ncbi:hypothetical protein [Actinokineospora sp. HUAS TT18]|uniref:hypothetical protein n=1 Tax=Actinokineospora sp. HUAS TT18 TaxID=3447451 RepID=UPI003F5276DC